MTASRVVAHVGGMVELSKEYIHKFISKSDLKRMSETMIYGLLASYECATDAGYNLEKLTSKDGEPLWDTGCILGTCCNGIELLVEDIGPNILKKKIRKLGISAIEKTMTSGVSAKVAGSFGLGNKVSTNSSACSTGGEAVLDGYFHILSGRADAMYCGGADGGAPYTWTGFDAMRMLTSGFNDNPHMASRPFCSTSHNFVAGSGAAVLHIETLERAQNRGAKIYAEILGGASNSGGQRQGGTMTAPNSTAVQRCIRDAIKNSGIDPENIDYINGHITGTMADELEIINWTKALEVSPETFPYVNATKGLIGHGLSASGAQELVATILQMENNFIHGSPNSDDLPEVLEAYRKSIPMDRVDTSINIAVKASFGFGDVNSIVVLRKL